MILKAKKFLSEFIGTMLMVFVGCGTGIAVNTMLSALGMGIPMAFSVAATALAFGLAVAAMYYCVGHISGAHLNPAVSFGMVLYGRMDPVDFVIYVVGQILGAIGGAGLVAAVLATRDTLFASGYGDLSTFGLTILEAVIVDVVLSFMLVLTYLSVSKKEELMKAAGIIYGLTFAAVYMVEIPFTGGSSNPARSIGSAVWQTNGDPLSQLWLFVAAPLLGAALAAIVMTFFDYEPVEGDKKEKKEKKEKKSWRKRKAGEETPLGTDAPEQGEEGGTGEAPAAEEAPTAEEALAAEETPAAQEDGDEGKDL